MTVNSLYVFKHTLIVEGLNIMIFLTIDFHWTDFYCHDTSMFAIQSSKQTAWWNINIILYSTLTTGLSSTDLKMYFCQYLDVHSFVYRVIETGEVIDLWSSSTICSWDRLLFMTWTCWVLFKHEWYNWMSTQLTEHFTYLSWHPVVKFLNSVIWLKVKAELKSVKSITLCTVDKP